MERWLPIAGHEGRYEVSDQGRVRSLRMVNGVVDRPRKYPLILAASLDGRGYPTVTLAKCNAKETRRVHVLVAETFLGPRPFGFVVRHIDGDSLNARLANLAYGTPAENEADKVAHGTRPFGEAVSGAVLTEGAVRTILSTYRRGSTEFGAPALARRFGCSADAVGLIIRGETWLHIDRSPYAIERTGWATKDAALKGVDAACVVCGVWFRRPRNRERPITCSLACRRDRKSQMSTKPRAEELRCGPLFGGEETFNDGQGGGGANNVPAEAA